MANFNWLEQWRQHGRSNGHSVFDLSKKMTFNLPNALIMPIRFIETVPDDHLNLSLSGLLRTETFNRAAFFQGKAMFSAFFVPYKQLWHNFNQFVIQKDDKHSSLYKSSQFAPVVDLENLYKFVFSCAYDGLRDEFGYLVGYQMAYLLQLCKYGNIYSLMQKYDPTDYLSYPARADYLAELKPFTDQVHGKKVNIFRLLAYQHIFYDFYRNKYYDENPYYIEVGDDPIPYIDTFNVDDIVCSSSADNELTFSYLGISDEYEGWFNDASSVRIANILKPHYCQYRKDLYTSLLPSTQFGAVSGLSFASSIDINDIDTDMSGEYYKADGSRLGTSGIWSSQFNFNNNKNALQVAFNTPEDAYHKHTIDGESLANNFRSISSFDVLSLRKAELLQQWKQNALRAGNMVDSNFESHYGVKPFYEDDNNVRFLGQWQCNLDVNPVTATSEYGSAKVGDLGAYGVGQIANNNIDVQIKDFGVIVICAHFASEVYYSGNGIDKQNTLVEPFDFFQSEFENSGMDTVVGSNQCPFIVGMNNASLGFTPPYTYHKTEVDETFGEYSALPYFVSNLDAGIVQGSLSAWTVRRSDFIYISSNGLYYSPVLSVNRFYQSPGLTDTIFGIKYNGNGNTDPFGFAVYIECKAIRPMSVLGIPIFG